jgi:hypothetical protein
MQHGVETEQPRHEEGSISIHDSAQIAKDIETSRRSLPILKWSRHENA